MVKRLKFDESGDSDDLQALFDSMSGTPAASIFPPRLEVVSQAGGQGDDDDLQALFDAVSSDYSASHEGASSADDGAGMAHSCNAVFNRIGVMTRQLHDTLRELGYDRSLQEIGRAHVWNSSHT